MTLKGMAPVHSTASRAEWHGFKSQLCRLLAEQPWASCSPSLSLSLLLCRVGCCESYRPECHMLRPPTLPAPPPTFRDRTGAQFVSHNCSSQLVGGLAGQEDPRPAGDRGPGILPQGYNLGSRGREQNVQQLDGGLCPEVTEGSTRQAGQGPTA